METPSTPLVDPSRIVDRLRLDDLDGAIESGLMRCDPAATDAPELVADARARLEAAWAARDRYRTRSARLARDSAERDARRTAALRAQAALPPAAAAALARAKAKAAGKP
jgi:hypothetical protein